MVDNGGQNGKIARFQGEEQKEGTGGKTGGKGEKYQSLEEEFIVSKGRAAGTNNVHHRLKVPCKVFL